MVFIFTHNLNILYLSYNVKKFKTTAKFYLKQQKQGTSSCLQGCLLSLILLPFQTVPGKLYFCPTIIKIYPVNAVWLHIEWVQDKYGVMLLHCYELLSCVYGGINETESHMKIWMW